MKKTSSCGCSSTWKKILIVLLAAIILGAVFLVDSNPQFFQGLMQWKRGVIIPKASEVEVIEEATQEKTADTGMTKATFTVSPVTTQ